MKTVEKLFLKSNEYNDDLSVDIRAMGNKVNEIIDLLNEILKEEKCCSCGDDTIDGFWHGENKCEQLNQSSTNSQPEEKGMEEKELPCLCPKWFSDGKGGWKKNLLETHAKGECPLYTEPLTEPKKMEELTRLDKIDQEVISESFKIPQTPTSNYQPEPQKPTKKPSEIIREYINDPYSYAYLPGYFKRLLDYLDELHDKKVL